MNKNKKLRTTKAPAKRTVGEATPKINTQRKKPKGQDEALTNRYA